MNKYLCYHGTSYEEMEKLFLQYIDQEQIVEFLEFLDAHNSSLLDEDELYKQETNEITTKGYNKLIPTTTYFVNVKEITLLIFSIICEAGLQSWLYEKSITSNEFPILPTLTELKKSLIKLQEENGEFCIVMECSRKNSAIKDFSNFQKPRNECFNNHFDCKFNVNGICKMSESYFNKAVEKMEQCNILIRRDDILKVQF